MRTERGTIPAIILILTFILASIVILIWIAQNLGSWAILTIFGVLLFVLIRYFVEKNELTADHRAKQFGCTGASE